VSGKTAYGFGVLMQTVVILSAFSLPCGGAGALAQSGDQNLTDEIVRKAEAKEAASGFCAGTGWPAGDSVEDFTTFLLRAVAGTKSVRTFKNGSCVLNLATEVHQEKGGKCVKYTFYTCPKDGDCGVGKSIDCLDRKGTFVKRRDG
jgi:hypothetical protein